MMGEPVPLETAWRWIDENAPRLDAESVALEAAHGRIPLDPPRAASDVPATSCAVEDGYAVSAEATVGAAPYNPLSCPIAEVSDGALPRGMVARVGAGQPLPAGANAVVPCDAVEPESDGRISVLAAVAAGAGVMMAASELRAGEPLWPAGRRRPLRARRDRPPERGRNRPPGGGQTATYADSDRGRRKRAGGARTHAARAGRAGRRRGDRRGPSRTRAG